MLLLQKVFLFSLLALFFQQATTDPKQALNDQLFEAVRKGDAAAVTAALDKGADVNAKFRYGATALFKAAERGHTEVAKVLIDRGADVNVKDTFYGATAMSWSSSPTARPQRPVMTVRNTARQRSSGRNMPMPTSSSLRARREPIAVPAAWPARRDRISPVRGSRRRADRRDRSARGGRA